MRCQTVRVLSFDVAASDYRSILILLIYAGP
jgi:hypothetical protein